MALKWLHAEVDFRHRIFHYYIIEPINYCLKMHTSSQKNTINSVFHTHNLWGWNRCLSHFSKTLVPFPFSHEETEYLDCRYFNIPSLLISIWVFLWLRLTHPFLFRKMFCWTTFNKKILIVEILNHELRLWKKKHIHDYII